MTKIEKTSTLDEQLRMPKSATLQHVCPMCGVHFTHLFAFNRHLLRQHWFEAQKEFSEERLQNRVEGLTEKQSQKLRELYQKLKERNSPTPPKRSRRTKPDSDQPYARGPRVSNLKEYKLVTVDDMSDAYKDKYNNPGGYTIFHFKVPKKTSSPAVVSPPLTALKKVYQSSDNKTSQKTEKVPITTSPKLSTWQQKSFQQHLSRGITHNIAQGVNSLVLRSPAAPQLTPPRATHVNSAHGGCEKCRRSKGSCDKDCSGYPQSVPLNFTSPLLRSNGFNCTDILRKIISSPESITKPEISLTVEDREAKVDVMSIDLTARSSISTPSPSHSSSSESPCSSRDLQYDSDQQQDPRPRTHNEYRNTDQRRSVDRLPDETLSFLAQIGLEMVYAQYPP